MHVMHASAFQNIIAIMHWLQVGRCHNDVPLTANSRGALHASSNKYWDPRYTDFELSDRYSD